jgi:hypothetical protein
METSALTATGSRRRSPVRDASRWSGAVFGVLFVASLAVAATTTSPYTSSAEDYANAYGDDGRAGLARALAMAVVIAFLWALARLHLALAGPRSGVAGAVIGPAGTLFAASFAGAAAAGTAVGNAVEAAGGFTDGGFKAVPETALVLDFVADGLVWSSLVAAAVMTWAVALAARRCGAVGGWVSWIGLVLVPLLPFAWLLFMAPVLIFAVWFAYLVVALPTQPRQSA